MAQSTNSFSLRRKVAKRRALENRAEVSLQVTTSWKWVLLEGVRSKSVQLV